MAGGRVATHCGPPVYHPQHDGKIWSVCVQKASYAIKFEPVFSFIWNKNDAEKLKLESHSDRTDQGKQVN